MMEVSIRFKPTTHGEIQMSGFSLLLIPVMAIAGVQVGSPKAAAIPYRLLDVKAPANVSPERLSYFVSVQNFLENSTVEELICQVIDKEKPAQGRDIGIAVYQGVERLSFADLVFGGEHNNHDIAIYLWSSGYARLSILRGPHGERLTPIKIYAFDHVTNCPSR